MARVNLDTVPKISRGGKTSKYADEMAELDELLSDEDARAVEGLVFDCDEENLSAMVSAFRKVGKNHNRKVNTVHKEGQLFVKDGGAYVGRQTAEAPAAPAAETPATPARSGRSRRSA